jgi:hypothetical protein
MMKKKFTNFKVALTFFYILLPIILGSCGLINASTVQLKYTDTEATFKGVKYENKEKLGEVSISVRNVQHPAKHGAWNFNIRISPSVHFDRFVYGPIEKTYDDNGNDTTPGDVKVRRLKMFGNLKANFHTPIGAFVATYGYGRAAYRQTDQEGLDTYRTREIKKIDFSWIGFFSRRFFVMMGPRYYEESYESYVFAFRIGYMFGKSK